MDVNKLASQIASLPGAEMIISLARYQHSATEFVSPDFELVDNGDEASMMWFDSDHKAASRFVPFAQSNDGGLFAYWRCEACTPIVYLASECEGSRVIAMGLEELLSMVAFGSSDYALDIECTDQDEEWDGPESTSQSLVAFRDWLKEECSIAVSDSPLATIKGAMAASPDLMSWIREWQNSR